MNRVKPKIPMAKPGTSARYAHAKLDGHFVRVERGGVGDARATTSHPTDITRLLPSKLWTEMMLLPLHSIALGELWVPDRPASCVKTAIKEQWPTLQITYFAIERLAGRGQLELERMPLEDVAELFDSWRLNFAPFEVVADVPVELSENQLDHYRARARAAGLEGWVLKTSNLLGWSKLKCENTMDLIVTGYRDGAGKYVGQIGSLLCSALVEGVLVEVAAVSGMTDDQRTDITEMCDDGSIKHRVVEVEYQRMDAKGRLRHPRFVQFRDDKRPEECTMDQDPDLAKYWQARAERFVETEPEKFLRVEREED